jgi:hypothetical protein
VATRQRPTLLARPETARRLRMAALRRAPRRVTRPLVRVRLAL